MKSNAANFFGNGPRVPKQNKKERILGFSVLPVASTHKFGCFGARGPAVRRVRTTFSGERCLSLRAATPEALRLWSLTDLSSLSRGGLLGNGR